MLIQKAAVPRGVRVTPLRDTKAFRVMLHYFHVIIRREGRASSSPPAELGCAAPEAANQTRAAALPRPRRASISLIRHRRREKARIEEKPKRNSSHKADTRCSVLWSSSLLFIFLLFLFLFLFFMIFFSSAERRVRPRETIVFLSELSSACMSLAFSALAPPRSSGPLFYQVQSLSLSLVRYHCLGLSSPSHVLISNGAGYARAVRAAISYPLRTKRLPCFLSVRLSRELNRSGAVESTMRGLLPGC